MRIILAAISLGVGLSAAAEVVVLKDLPAEVWIQESITILEEPRTERGIEIEPGTVLIENPTTERREIPLLSLDSPGVSSDRYAVLGEVFHVDVEDEGYLETWNHFEKGGPYFTRTLSEFGPMRWLANTSMGFREFSLPFSIGNDEGMRPTRIELNLILPSTGRVYLRNVRLVEYTGASQINTTPGEWWGVQTSGRVGAGIGIFGGLLGGLIGCCGPWVAKGRAKGICMGLLVFMAAAGVLQTMVALIALFGGQPNHVYSPLLSAGLLMSILGIIFLLVIGGRYRQAELRKMRAMDA